MNASKRTVLLIPFGAVATLMVAASAAFACATWLGTLDVKGDASSIVGTSTGNSSIHTIPTLSYSSGSVPSAACAARNVTGVSTLPCQGQTTVGDGQHGWVELRTRSNANGELPDSDEEYDDDGSVTNPCPGAGVRCFGDGPLPPVGVDSTNKLGHYYVTLMEGPTYVDDDGDNAVTKDDRASANCANPGTPPMQHVRYVHLAFATVDSGVGFESEFTDMDLPLVGTGTVNRPTATELDPTTPDPELVSGTSHTYRVFLPHTQALAGSVQPASNSYSKICVNDRYGIVNQEMPLGIFTI